MSIYEREKALKRPGTKVERMREKNERINGGFYQFPNHVSQSHAFRSLSGHATKVLMRVVLEHTYCFRKKNGSLLVTHRDFRDEWINPNKIAEAIEELAFKGLLRVSKGNGHGVKLPNIFTITFFPTEDGLSATNDYQKCDVERVLAWQTLVSQRRKNAKSRKIHSHDGVSVKSEHSHDGVSVEKNGQIQKAQKSGHFSKIHSHTVVSTINNMVGTSAVGSNGLLQGVHTPFPCLRKNLAKKRKLRGQP
ncbi:hypothetical protein HQ945_00975 [Phyllobacterium sp. BT25]|uniref:Uncharacterized protein n=1 Tax=Phyllobacterium pellucidum TaxID=2740464 RepID=A0A849VL93_9HYPH|nr:hypothetical protein [Phyllobacterium pellucidum]NTS29814.1 hypothetical protein [Phyllobacterium pellucidum]